MSRDYYKDVEELYGSDKDRLNKKREELFNEFNFVVNNLGMLKGVIQNPVSISERQLVEWKDMKNSLTKLLVDVLNDVEEFVEDNHVE